MDEYTGPLAELRTALPAALGNDLLALYLHRGPPSHATRSEAPLAHLWLCVQPETKMRRLREAFLPLWRNCSEFLTRGPAVAAPADWTRYSLLFPDVVGTLRQEAQLLTGTDVLRQLPRPSPLPSQVQMSRTATEAMRCSALLSGTALSAEQSITLERQLRRLCARQSGQGSASGAPPLTVLGELHASLSAQSESYPQYLWDGPEPTEEPPPHLPGLVSLVGFEDQLIVVMPQVDQPFLSNTDWSLVTELVSDEFTGIMVATPWQLRLAAAIELSLDLQMRSFELVWGSDLLADLVPSEQHIVAGAAALPARVLVKQLPAAYLTVDEDGLGKLIHDIQNVLFNVQLPAELMARRKGVPVPSPPDPLPGRESPPHDRIAATFSHFRWWAEHLTADLQQLQS